MYGYITYFETWPNPVIVANRKAALFREFALSTIGNAGIEPLQFGGVRERSSFIYVRERLAQR